MRKYLILKRKANLIKDPLPTPDSNDKIDNIIPLTTNSQYLGNLANNERDGFGTETWSNGTYLVTIFMNNVANGYGKITLANEDMYKGEFVNGKANGYGIYTFYKKGSLYEGYWKGGLMVRVIWEKSQMGKRTGLGYILDRMIESITVNGKIIV